MENALRTDFDNLWSADRDLQNAAFSRVLELTEKPVDWSYQVWAEVVENLGHRDNHNRAIAAQVLCNLARSDPQERILKDFPELLNVTRDNRFVTARHCMQALWKIGLAGPEQRAMLVAGLASRFQECSAERNTTLIRYDICESLRNVFDATGDEAVRNKALQLIETEDDQKYRKKYASLWKAKGRSK